ncbi:Fe-S protein assembly chaperone HscA [Catenovulum adriaticum]|uniref:Chaperone protein HscA homolog n=1 Tax=Catenovulum adriaticum TaxID=2984846 RepID=A0ABY7AIJ0_9ALTE|nr:Fe-S protein assembly chaperone HscA [Catenovulum sp. TS8]WAJ69023.1 Fe-S protein assembly chaperone HscA [Catenovulum sp. TS8]
MALLQISEPGQTTAPHQRKLAIGIDLGTTNSLVATVRSGEAQPLADESGVKMLPSVVQYAESETRVGYAALAQAEADPENTIISVKRFMGRSLDDVLTTYPELPYHFEGDSAQLSRIKTRQGDKSPIEVSADILANLKLRAERVLGDELQGAVITVPAYFDDAQRQGTKDAARIAGLKVLRLLNEPTAAAIAYGLDSKQEGEIAVYDLGGGTFDISILKLDKGVFEVLSTGGDSALGGDDFDQAIVDWIKQNAKLTQTLSSRERRVLKEQAKKAKEALSDADSTQVQIKLDDGNQINLRLTLVEFNELIAPLVQKTMIACRRALKDAELKPDEIKDVVLVGGSTRVPLVREKAAEFFGQTPLNSIDPDEVVAVGASIQADILVGNKPDSDMVLLDVTPLSLGLETMGGLTEKIIGRNTTIPVAKAQEFTTFKDGQTAMALHVVQGERELVKDCRSLAKFELRDIPPMAAGAAHIRVTFQVDADGLLSVTAMEKSTEVQASIQVKPSYGLEESEILDMLKSSIDNAQDDVEARRLAEQVVEAARMLESLGNALKADGHLLEDDARNALYAELTQLQTLSQQSDVDAIKKQIEKIDHLSQDFAAARMDESIKQALKGQQVDEI